MLALFRKGILAGLFGYACYIGTAFVESHGNAPAPVTSGYCQWTVGNVNDCPA